MKKKLIVSMAFIIIFSMFFVGCTNQSEDNFSKPGSNTDIKQITKSYSKSDSELNYQIDLQVGKLYHAISSDQSASAIRIIGNIEGHDISAKEMELRALKYQASGSKNPYKDAWDNMKLTIYEENLAKKYNINVDNIVRDNINNTRKSFEENKDIYEKQSKIIQAYGVSEDEYWNNIVYNGIKRIITHNLLSDYLKTNNLNSINVNSIESKITDDKYYNEINKN